MLCMNKAARDSYGGTGTCTGTLTKVISKGCVVGYPSIEMFIANRGIDNYKLL